MLLRVVVFCLIPLPLLAAKAVQHSPASPLPNTVVTVTAKQPAGATKVTLKLQSVAPGQYIRKTDPAYKTAWTDLPMHDDGKDGDTTAGDGTYTVRVPADQQKHRHLIRYRVAAEVNGNAVVLPASDATSPNYAYWCDAGPAAWSGSPDPGKTAATTYSTDFLKTLQTLHLIANRDDVRKSQWDGAANRQKQQGTLVYRGEVFDHVFYSNRGQGSAYISGKNKWSLKPHHDHEIRMHNADGSAWPAATDSLNLNPGGSTPHLPVHRGIGGLDEVLSMTAYRLARVPAPASTWVQWRVVDRENEVDPKDQYRGDLWGLYVVVGDMSPKLLADPPLADGLTVSIQSGVKHTPKGFENADKVWEKFISTERGNPKEDWWRANLDLPAYYSFHALNRLLGNVDLRPDGNHGYYRRPDGHWAPIPWDNDMMFVPRQHQPGYIDAIKCLDHAAIQLEYRNRAREILDLFAADSSRNGGQIGQLTYDLSAPLTPKAFKLDWPRLDAVLWNQHPHMNQRGSYYVNPLQADHFGGRWTRTLATNDFAGFQKYIVDFTTDCRPKKNYAPNDGDARGYGWGYLAHEAKDEKIPARPSVTRSGMEYKFDAAKFDSPAKASTAALEWRVGRVGKPGWYELDTHWKGETQEPTVTIPAAVFNTPGEYRIRARWRDATGRASHWSAAVNVTVQR